MYSNCSLYIQYSTSIPGLLFMYSFLYVCKCFLLLTYEYILQKSKLKSFALVVCSLKKISFFVLVFIFCMHSWSLKFIRKSCFLVHQNLSQVCCIFFLFLLTSCLPAFFYFSCFPVLFSSSLLVLQSYGILTFSHRVILASCHLLKLLDVRLSSCHLLSSCILVVFSLCPHVILNFFISVFVSS